MPQKFWQRIRKEFVQLRTCLKPISITNFRSMKQDPKSVEAYSDMEKIKQFFAFQVESDNPILSSTTTERNSRGLNFNLEEEFQDHGGEVFDEIDDTTGTRLILN